MAQTHPQTHEAIRAKFESYADGELPEAEAKQVEEHLLSCEECEQAFEAFQREQVGLSGLHRMSAPQDFEKAVEEVIHRRSQGRFFGRRAFGDRVPFEILAIVALAIALTVYLLLRMSNTGSLEVPGDKGPNVSDKKVDDAIP
jgi:anti-sigma factor RsiW